MEVRDRRHPCRGLILLRSKKREGERERLREKRARKKGSSSQKNIGPSKGYGNRKVWGEKADQTGRKRGGGGGSNFTPEELIATRGSMVRAPVRVAYDGKGAAGRISSGNGGRFLLW